MNDRVSKSAVYANQHFLVEPCLICPVAGYLIVSPIVPCISLSELDYDALVSLGPTLAAATRAIEVAVQPQRVYCALFAEQTKSVHFHLFPRSASILSEYASAHPADPEISGPRLLDWARRTFHLPTTDNYIETVEAIFRELRRHV